MQFTFSDDDLGNIEYALRLLYSSYHGSTFYYASIRDGKKSDIYEQKMDSVGELYEKIFSKKLFL